MRIEADKFYTTAEVAEMLNVSDVTAKRYIASKTIPSIKVGGSRRVKGQYIVHLGRPQTKIKALKKGLEIDYDGKLSEAEVLSDTAAVNLKKIAGTSGQNLLISGDNLHILKSLLPKYSGKIDLIYIDPPFGTGQEFVGYNEEHFYSDRLVNAEFLEFLRRRLIFLRELLSERGSIYLHIDTKIGHYVKLVMDEVFGQENFRNDITRIKCNPKNFERKAYGNIKDLILFYSKTPPGSKDKMYWNDHRLELTEDEIIRQFPKTDANGRRYATTPLHAKGETRRGPTGQAWKGLKPPRGRHWRYHPDELTRLDELGLIEWSASGNPRKKIYADENRGKKVQDIWDFKDPGYEKSLYPTEKNLGLLEHIIKSSSAENGLVLDCFSGSGTTVIAAQKLNRRWIGIDSNRSAIKLTQRRLESLSNQSNLFAAPLKYAVYQAATPTR